MDIEKLPWKETLLIFLLVALSMSMNDLRLKDNIIRYIAMHPWIRFLIIFMTSFLIFSLDIDRKYSILTRVIVSALIAFVVQTFLTVNATLLTLQPPSPDEKQNTNNQYPFAG
jgi:hypothetical protein